MKKMTKQNLRNIRCRFEEKTGVDLNPRHRQQPVPVRKLWVLAAAIVACLSMLAFTNPLFSSLDGDELSLAGNYEGNGIVSIRVENRSDKVLNFQHDTKLMRWITGEEMTRLQGKPVFKNTEFAPHSEGIMTIDLSGAYDVEALEQTHGEWFYLLLTNNGFLFGQDWMCSVDFGGSGPEAEPERGPLPSVAAGVDVLAGIDEELRFYFEQSYTGELMAFNGPNFQYQQKVEEILARFEGTVVPALSPVAMVGGPSVFLDPEPIMGKPPEDVVFDNTFPEDRQYLLTLSDWTYTDAYGRMVATANEKAWAQTVTVPQRQGETDGGVGLPLIFLFVYDADMAQPENHAFLYGRLHSFVELETYKVLEDEHYAIYDATDLIYTDVDKYLDDFLASRSDVYCDDQIRQRVRNVFDFYRDPENIRAMYGYLEFPES